MIDIRALTDHQPYATLLAIGVKPWETRSWPTKYRGLVAFHAARLPVERTLSILSEEAKAVIFRLMATSPIKLEIRFPHGAVVGIGNLVDCQLIDDDFISRLTYEQRLLGNFMPGRFAWKFEDVVAFKKPYKMRGAQSLWHIRNGEEIMMLREYNVKTAAS